MMDREEGTQHNLADRSTHGRMRKISCLRMGHHSCGLRCGIAVIEGSLFMADAIFAMVLLLLLIMAIKGDWDEDIREMLERAP